MHAVRVALVKQALLEEGSAAADREQRQNTSQQLCATAVNSA
jgi:hypothetical protein